MARPGIMLYFDILEPIRELPDAEKGQLLVAMLEYGQSGKIPEFDGKLGLTLAWGFIRPKLDKDSEEYNKTVLKRQYATFCRDRKKKGEPEVSFDEWVMTIDNQSYQMISSDTKWYPTTTTPTTPSTNTSTFTSTTTAATTNTTEDTAAAADRSVKVLGGKLGKDVVFLSDAQMEDLLDKMGLEAFDHYVDKLSCFIIKNDAHVKNHYETILKWWQEDGTVHKHYKQKSEVPKGASGKLGQAELDAIQRVLSDA